VWRWGSALGWWAAHGLLWFLSARRREKTGIESWWDDSAWGAFVLRTRRGVGVEPEAVEAENPTGCSGAMCSFVLWVVA